MITSLTPIFCSFVSFLLRIAHDKTLRDHGANVPSNPPEDLIVEQIEALAAQIVKTSENTSNAKAESAMGGAMMQANRFQRLAMMAEMRGVTHGGVNF